METMNNEYLKELVGKTLRLSLKNGFYYKGKILSVGEDFLVILDKVGKKVIISLDTIDTVEVEE